MNTAIDMAYTTERLDWCPKMLKLDPLPILSPCYCADCKRPLTASRVLDQQHAWCPGCESVVTTTWFQVPAWTVGMVVFLFLNNLLLS